MVDEEDIKKIKPLPNLDYKIVCGNSLLGYPYKPLRLEKLEKLKDEFFDETNPKKKQMLKHEIDTTIYNFYKTTGKSLGHEITFDFKINFSEVFHNGNNGFDVVIANPPYIGIEDITKDFRNFYETFFKTATGRFDLYSLFIEKAMQIKRHSGAFAYIIPGKFLNNKQFVTARKIICENHGVTVVKIDDKVFTKSQVDSVIVENYLPAKSSKPKYKAFKITGQELQSLSETEVDTILLDKEVIFRLEINTKLENLILKIRNSTFRFIEIGEVKDGIIAGLLKDILFLEEKTNKDCHPLYFGKQINRYYLGNTGIYVDYRPEFMLNEELKRKKGSAPGLRMRDKRIFEREKILYRKVGKELIATYDGKGGYYEQTVHSAHITDKRFQTKYILGIFNSKLLKFYYQKTNSQGGDIFPQVRISSVENLPIKLVDNITQEKIVKVVDQILNTKQKNPTTDTSELEKKIDEMVYALYNLASEEIRIVEGRSE